MLKGSSESFWSYIMALIEVGLVTTNGVEGLLKSTNNLGALWGGKLPKLYLKHLPMAIFFSCLVIKICAGYIWLSN